MAASTLRHGADLPIVLMVVLLALRAQHDVLLGQPLVTVISLEISGDRVAVLHVIGNPAKLSRLNRLAEP